jgi:signal transduction histidine kinase
MAETKKTKTLIAELSHEINTPLAVIRNALYLVGVRTSDPQLQEFIQAADEGVNRIVSALRTTRERLDWERQTMRAA